MSKYWKTLKIKENKKYFYSDILKRSFKANKENTILDRLRNELKRKELNNVIENYKKIVYEHKIKYRKQ